MTVAILEPLAPPVGSDTDEPAHYWCCSERTALCGVDLTDAELVDVDDGGRDCSLCLYVLDEKLPCPVAGCTEAGAV